MAVLLQSPGIILPSPPFSVENILMDNQLRLLVQESESAKSADKALAKTSPEITINRQTYQLYSLDFFSGVSGNIDFESPPTADSTLCWSPTSQT